MEKIINLDLFMIHENLSILFEKSKLEIKNEYLHEKNKKLHIKQKSILKCKARLTSQSSTELNAKLSIIDTLSKRCGN